MISNSDVQSYQLRKAWNYFSYLAGPQPPADSNTGDTSAIYGIGTKLTAYRRPFTWRLTDNFTTRENLQNMLNTRFQLKL